MPTDAEKFWRDGYLIIKGLLRPGEVLRWREAALARGKTMADLLSDDVLQDVVLDTRLIDAARQILGGDPIYFCDSTAAIGPNGWGFHKDNSDRTDPKAPDWQVERYPIIRFGIYCQPHGHAPGGLDLREGSHMHPDYDTGRFSSAETEVGDVVVWNARTSHSADSKLLRLLGYRVTPKPTSLVFRAMNRLPARLLFRQRADTRVALFASYAVDHPLLYRHIEYLKQRTYPWDIWEASSWSVRAREKAELGGLKLIDLTNEVFDERVTHASYHQLPY